MVPDPLHPRAHPLGQGPGEPDSPVPLVRRPLHHQLLLRHPALHLQPVAGRLAGPGRRAGAHRGVDHLGRRGEHAADAPAAVAAAVPALMGLPPPVDALPGALGPQGLLDAGPLLLLLQVLSDGSAGRGAGSGEGCEGRAPAQDV